MRGEPLRRVTVLLGVGELARVEWAVEKGTECGAARFVLVAAARSQRAHVAAAAAKLDRLRRIAAEAVKQCDRSRRPGRPRSAASRRRPRALRRAALRRPPGRTPARLRGRFAGASTSPSPSGPEGGFDAAEERLLDEAGAVPFGLGGRILRLETAVVAALVRLVDDDAP